MNSWNHFPLREMDTTNASCRPFRRSIYMLIATVLILFSFWLGFYVGTQEMNFPDVSSGEPRRFFQEEYR